MAAPAHAHTPLQWRRHHSDSEMIIKRALRRACAPTNTDLVGDYTRAHSLRIVPGKHPDVKYISAETLADVLRRRNQDDAAKENVMENGRGDLDNAMVRECRDLQVIRTTS